MQVWELILQLSKTDAIKEDERHAGSRQLSYKSCSLLRDRNKRFVYAIYESSCVCADILDIRGLDVSALKDTAFSLQTGVAAGSGSQRTLKAAGIRLSRGMTSNRTCSCFAESD